MRGFFYSNWKNRTEIKRIVKFYVILKTFFGLQDSAFWFFFILVIYVYFQIIKVGRQVDKTDDFSTLFWGGKEAVNRGVKAAEAACEICTVYGKVATPQSIVTVFFASKMGISTARTDHTLIDRLNSIKRDWISSSLKSTPND